MNQSFKKGFYYSLSFIIPFFIIFFSLLAKGISWGSQTTILASDCFHQYVIFAQVLRNILHGQDSLFYTFTSGLGINFYALMSYYLGSFLAPFYFFFKLQNMPDAIYLFTLIKIGLIGLSSFYSIKHLYLKIPYLLILCLSSSYALMSFSVSQLEINMWLDVFILIPLIILGLHQLISERRFLLYYVSLSLLFIQNYYFGFMSAIFLAGYFLVQLTRFSHFKSIWRPILDFTVMSILAGLTSAVMLLPTYFDLSTHGETFTSVKSLLTENTWYLDLFAKNLVGAYDTTKFGAIPTIYVGILPLILAISFFTLKEIDWKIRVAYFLFLAFIIASFSLQQLDLLWQGMHSPNMFLHRYSWVFSTLIIYLAAERLDNRLTSQYIKNDLISLLIISSGFLATYFYRDHYSFLSQFNFLLTLAFLSAYLILLVNISNKKIPSYFILAFTLLFSVIELSLNTYYQVNALGDEWVFPTRNGYNSHLNSIEKLVKYAKSDNSNSFYRTERILPQTGNDSMKYNYNGISQFSSIRNRTSSHIMDRLGYKSDGTNLNLRYQNNTLLADSLFGIKYNLSEFTVRKLGFTLSNQTNDMKLYQNQNASSLGILSSKLYKDVNFTVNTLDNQKNLVNQITGLNENYFSLINANLVNGAQILNQRVVSNNQSNDSTTITYQFRVTNNAQVYVNMSNITFSNDAKKDIFATVNGLTNQYTIDNAFPLFDLCHFKANDIVTVSFNFPQNKQISFDQPQFYALDQTAFENATTKLKKSSVSSKVNGNKIYFDYKISKNRSLLITLPYDQGWSAKVNGKKIAITKFQEGFMKVNLKKGKGQIVLTFIPKGFILGMILSIIGVCLFILYNFLSKTSILTQKSNQKEKAYS